MHQKVPQDFHHDNEFLKNATEVLGNQVETLRFLLSTKEFTSDVAVMFFSYEEIAEFLCDELIRNNREGFMLACLESTKDYFDKSIRTPEWFAPLRQEAWNHTRNKYPELDESLPVEWINELL